MVKPRISETDRGITGEFNTQMYDIMMRNMRDKGWIETNLIIKEGISSGLALEIGPGPGYLGLEWLKKTTGTRLKGLEISDDMIALARKNAIEYGLPIELNITRGMRRRCLLRITILTLSSLMAHCTSGRILKIYLMKSLE